MACKGLKTNSEALWNCEDIKAAIGVCLNSVRSLCIYLWFSVRRGCNTTAVTQGIQKGGKEGESILQREWQKQKVRQSYREGNKFVKWQVQSRGDETRMKREMRRKQQSTRGKAISRWGEMWNPKEGNILGWNHSLSSWTTPVFLKFGCQLHPLNTFRKEYKLWLYSVADMDRWRHNSWAVSYTSVKTTWSLLPWGACAQSVQWSHKNWQARGLPHRSSHSLSDKKKIYMSLWSRQTHGHIIIKALASESYSTACTRLIRRPLGSPLTSDCLNEPVTLCFHRIWSLFIPI